MKKNAFTIIETLVTLLAITIMISAPLAFMARSSNYSEVIRTKIIATGLSQEGLELATSLRNLNLANFQTAVSSCTSGADSGCMIDWDGVSDTPTMEGCAVENCQLFSESSDITQMYRKTGDTATGYFRYLTFVDNGGQSYTVESVVYSFVNQIKVEVKLKKVMSNINVK